MKNIGIISIVLFGLLFGFTSCDKESGRTYYSGKEYIMFSQTQHEYPVQVDGTFKVTVASTVACDYDRTVGVEVVNNGSSAIEGRHFELLSHNITIKAGKRVAEIEVRGIYDHITATDSLGTRLRLLVPENVKWELYPENLETTITFRKFCPFSLEDWFDCEDSKGKYGNYIFYATFPFQQMQKILVKAYQDKADPYRMTLTNPFRSDKDLNLRLHAGGPGENRVSVYPQEAFYTSNMGWVSVASIDNACYYNSCEKFMTLMLKTDIDHMIGADGHFYMLEWITQKQADDMRNKGQGEIIQ